MLAKLTSGLLLKTGKRVIVGDWQEGYYLRLARGLILGTDKRVITED